MGHKTKVLKSISEEVINVGSSDSIRKDIGKMLMSRAMKSFGNSQTFYPNKRKMEEISNVLSTAKSYIS